MPIDPRSSFLSLGELRREYCPAALGESRERNRLDRVLRPRAPLFWSVRLIVWSGDDGRSGKIACGRINQDMELPPDSFAILIVVVVGEYIRGPL